VALAEAAFGSGLGAEVELDSTAAELFSESQARAIVAVAADHIDEFFEAAETFGVPSANVGSTGGDRLIVRFDGGAVDTTVAGLQNLWSTALPRALEG